MCSAMSIANWHLFSKVRLNRRPEQTEAFSKIFQIIFVTFTVKYYRSQFMRKLRSSSTVRSFKFIIRGGYDFKIILATPLTP
jgi:hypothetical protein